MTKRMRWAYAARGAVWILGLLAGLGLQGCGGSDGGGPGSGTPPEVSEATITVDRPEQTGLLTVTASDPDGPVGIVCTGAFDARGTNHMTVQRSFAELRRFPQLETTCQFRERSDVVERQLTYVDSLHPNYLDGPPFGVVGPIDIPVTGRPMRFLVRAGDDWALTRYRVEWAPGETTAACDGATTRLPEATFTPPTKIRRDTVTMTFSAVGKHCVQITTADDAGHTGRGNRLVLVSDPVPPVVSAAAMLGEYEGREQFEQTAITLQLAIQDVSDSVRGKWAMHYSLSTASDEGSFSGTYVGGVLTLPLRIEIGGCSGSYTLTGRALDPAGDHWAFAVATFGNCRPFATGPITVDRQRDIPHFPK